MDKKRVGFQGEPGAYSEEAIYQHFGEGAEAVPLKIVADVFERVSGGEVDFGMIPVENSIGGNVYESYDRLISSDLSVVAEVYLRVHHCLIANRGTELSMVKRVYSHPQALEQCRNFISGLGSEMASTFDTAGSARMIRDSGSMDAAAIASVRAADIYGLNVLRRNVEDSPNNITRFLVISRSPVSPSGECKTSIVFQVPHRPGRLHDAMGIFARHGINLTKIESRPTRERPWEYYFLIDFEASSSDPETAAALGELAGRATFLRVIGSYPRGTF